MDQGHDGRVGHPELVGRQPVGRELPRQEVPGRDDALLPLGVAGQVEDRHPLPPHPRHRTEAVGGRHEDGVGQGRARDRDSGRGTPRRARGRRPRGGPPARRRRRRRGGRSRRGRTRGRERRTLPCLTRSVIKTDPQQPARRSRPGTARPRSRVPRSLAPYLPATTRAKSACHGTLQLLAVSESASESRVGASVRSGRRSRCCPSTTTGSESSSIDSRDRLSSAAVPRRRRHSTRRRSGCPSPSERKRLSACPRSSRGER